MTANRAATIQMMDHPEARCTISDMTVARTRTKIVATLGPASNTQPILERFIDAGVDVFRLNMSHGTQAEHTKTLAAARAAAQTKREHIAVIADLCGPKIRIGTIDERNDRIDVGDTCLIVRREIDGDATRFCTNYPEVVTDVQIGQRVLIDDGSIRLLVSEKTDEHLVCTCMTGGRLATRKGVNLPESDLSLPSLTDKDRSDIAWAIEHEVDFVAVSFVRRPYDIDQVRALLDDGGSDIPIIAKIETPQAVAAIDAIIDTSNGILVARGDLGVEMDVSRIPLLQKDIVRRCGRVGKPVIVATQMLHSMVESPMPTRAEVSDVANAVLDGTDAVMLSAESAVGRFPIEAIAMMNRIADDAYEYEAGLMRRPHTLLHETIRVGEAVDPTRSSVARIAALAAQDLDARLLAVWCRSGTTARWISKYRIDAPIVGLSGREATCRRLVLSYGIEAMLVSEGNMHGDTPWRDVETLLVRRFDLEPGDIIIVVGDPEGTGREATLRIEPVSGT